MGREIVRSVSPPQTLYNRVSNNLCIHCSGRGFFRNGYLNDDPVRPIITICRVCHGYGERVHRVTVSRVLTVMAVATVLVMFGVIPLFRIFFR